MNESIISVISVFLGALISMVASFISNHSENKRTEEHERNETERVKIKTDSENLRQKLELSHDTRIQNREIITPAVKEVLTSLIEYYECTKNLVINYPGAYLTGKHPEFLFEKTLSNLGSGFPESLTELRNLDTDWIAKSNKFNNVFSINGPFLSKDLQNNLNNFSRDAKNIKDYFYGYYCEIKNDTDFENKRRENEKNARNPEYYLNDTVTDHMLNCFTKMTNDKNMIINDADSYIQKLISE